MRHNEKNLGLLEVLNTRLGPGEVNYHLNCSFQNSYMYFETPKCGCTFIKSILGRAELESQGFFSPESKVFSDYLEPTPHKPPNRYPFIKPYQLKPAQLASFLAEKKCLKFIVCRNPYTRIISGYLDKILGANSRGTLYWKQLIPAYKELGLNTEMIAPNEIAFVTFLQALKIQKERKGWRSINHHFRQQVFHTGADAQFYDKIIRLEEFESSYTWLQKLVPVKVLFENNKKGEHLTNAGSRYREFINTETKDLIEDLYRDDFVFFGY